MNKAELIAAINDHKVKGVEFTEENAPTNAVLEVILEGLESKGKIEGLQKEKEDLEVINEGLNETIEELSTEKKVKSPVITYKKKRYEVLAPSVNLGGEKYGLEDLREDKNGVVKTLLSMDGQNVLRELSEE